VGYILSPRHVGANFFAVRQFLHRRFDAPIRGPLTYAKDLRPYFRLDHQFLSQLAAQRGFQVFTVFHLASGKFPLHSISVRMMTLADQDKVAIYYDAGADEDGFLFSHKGTVF
jgi:hypothetical protein